MTQKNVARKKVFPNFAKIKAMKRLGVITSLLLGMVLMAMPVFQATGANDKEKGALVVKAKMEGSTAEEVKKALLSVKGVEKVAIQGDEVEVIFDAKMVGCCKNLLQTIKSHAVEYEVLKIDNPACKGKGKCCTGKDKSCETKSESHKCNHSHEKGETHKCHHSH
jgi:hypothetical protein